jgi:C-terminal processing protease CtpA/Prc
LDGKPIRDWLDVADAFIAEGSLQYKLMRGVRFLRYLQFLRGELGQELKPTVDVEVVSEDGKDAETLSLDISDQLPEYGEWPMRDSQLFDSNIGYLRITRMRSWAVDLVDKWMHYFRGTEGLIVDVRSNGGGSREALRALFPYLMNEDDRPWINNVGVYRLYRGYEPHHMTARFMYREDSPHWTAEEKAAIEELRRRWTPQWEPPEDEISQWHYMIMSRRINPNAYTYTEPVVILMDYRCFSATDIFLSTFKGWKNVTLMGTPSGGGSALSQNFELPRSHLRVRIGSMVSFQRNGNLHDGNGTHPDVRTERTPESFLRFGKDNQLEKAIEVLGTK